MGLPQRSDLLERGQQYPFSWKRHNFVHNLDLVFTCYVVSHRSALTSRMVYRKGYVIPPPPQQSVTSTNTNFITFVKSTTFVTIAQVYHIITFVTIITVGCNIYLHYHVCHICLFIMSVMFFGLPLLSRSSDYHICHVFRFVTFVECVTFSTFVSRHLIMPLEMYCFNF